MSRAMTEICAYLKNWFDRDQKKITAKFAIVDGVITDESGNSIGLVTEDNDITETNGDSVGLLPNQYFRIIGSLLNDGVWKYQGDGDDTIRLRDETFTGTIWFMAVPPAVEAIAAEVHDWMAKYDNIDSPSMSPYTSESFGGYSYSKSGGSSGTGSDFGGGWQSVFSGRLRPWKKI